MRLTPSLEQAQAILRGLDRRMVLHGPVQPLGGLTGSVFLLSTNTDGLILRVFDEASASWKPEKEQTVCGLMHEHGLPAPRTLALDLSRTLIPFAYSISERLPGVTLSSAYDGLTVGRRSSIAAQLGDCLGRMHSLSFDRCGDVARQNGVVGVGPALELREEDPQADPGPFSTWREMHSQITQGRLHYLRRTEFRDLVPPIARWFASHEKMLDYAVTPRLLHVDFHRGNILVSGDEVTGILDSGEAVIGHNEYDLMRTELAHFGNGEDAERETFFSAYARHVMLDTGYTSRRPFYELSRSLVGLKCLVAYGSSYAPGNLEWEKQSARRRILDLLSTA